MPIAVTTAAQAAARDAAAIAAGTPSSTLMARAGAAAVRAIVRYAGERCGGGVAVFAGPGNNGGDAWVVAGSLRTAGVQVRVHATAQPATPDARAAQATALARGPFDEPRGDERVAVDGLLGTGSAGAPRDAIARALATLGDLRARGAMTFALDVPSGLDATTGEASPLCVPTDVTITFGTLKRGLTVARALCGAIEVADIGLGAAALLNDGAAALLDPHAARTAIPPIGASAHKGTRGRVAIVGGAEGMAGAAVFAARGALRAGAGLVRVVVAPASLAAMQAAVPEATGAVWPSETSHVRDALGGADAVVIGPGLGAANRALLDMVIAGCGTPVVLDADALNAYAGAAPALKAAIGDRAAIITPHAAECARLMGVSTADVLRERFDIGLALARACGAVVVLKGTPTVVSAPDGRVVVAPVGSPVLATGGSGDVLAGVAGTLLASIPDAYQAALSAVWAHGAAAERVATSRVRGATLADVVDALRDVWHSEPPALDEGVLASLPAVGER
jgi:hydroxyethylthiazole kinase-like uncharacterized protein yjeF